MYKGGAIWVCVILGATHAPTHLINFRRKFRWFLEVWHFLLKMAYNYVVTAHKPTAVNTCVTGNLQIFIFGIAWRYLFTVINIYLLSHVFSKLASRAVPKKTNQILKEPSSFKIRYSGRPLRYSANWWKRPFPFLTRAKGLWSCLMRMDSWLKLCNTHCLFTLKALLIGYQP